jgi:hypothetical protein
MKILFDICVFFCIFLCLMLRITIPEIICSYSGGAWFKAFAEISPVCFCILSFELIFWKFLYVLLILKVSIFSGCICNTEDMANKDSKKLLSISLLQYTTFFYQWFVDGHPSKRLCSYKVYLSLSFNRQSSCSRLGDPVSVVEQCSLGMTWRFLGL